MADSEVRKRSRDESELILDSPAVKRLREDLLDDDDDEETVAEICTGSQDLDSFMKSFEDEIAASPVVDPDLALDSVECRPDLGFLLEASDDELGLPPTTSSPCGELESEFRNELARIDSDSSELGGEFWEIPDYDSFGFGFGSADNGEYVALDGLFDYSDVDFGSGDVSRRPELPA